MADHRAESIILAVVAKVTSLTTTGARVFRGRVYPLQDSEEPGLCVFMGPDNPDEVAETFNIINSMLTITVAAYVKTSASQVDTVLNQIRKEVTIALQVDNTQGLIYVLETIEGPATPSLSGEGDKPSGYLNMDWKIQYRRSRLDPSA
jgi:hypothetical protein